MTTLVPELGMPARIIAYVLAALGEALDLVDLLAEPRHRPWGARVREANESIAWYMRQAMVALDR